MDDELDLSPLFLALTKPPMIMGVEHDFFIIAFFVVICVFIMSGNLLSLLAFIPLHAVGWLLTYIDPNIFKLLSVQAGLGMTRNKQFWGCESYEAV